MRHEAAIKLINKEIDQLSKKRTKLEEKCNENPAADLLALYAESKEKFEQYKTVEQRTSPEFLEWATDAAEREKKAKARLNSSIKNSGKYQDQLFEITQTIGQLADTLNLLRLRSGQL